MSHMTPEEWKQVKDIIEQVEVSEESSADQLVESLCAHDPALRSRVRALLKYESKAEGFLSNLNMSDVEIRFREKDARIAAGHRIGRFTISGLRGDRDRLPRQAGESQTRCSAEAPASNTLIA